MGDRHGSGRRLESCGGTTAGGHHERPGQVGPASWLRPNKAHLARMRTLLVEPGADGQDPPMVVWFGQQVELGEDAADVGLDGLVGE